MLLAENLPVILLLAVAWAEARSAEILRYGEPLPAAERELATRMGVGSPDKIRLQLVSRLARLATFWLCT